MKHINEAICSTLIALAYAVLIVAVVRYAIAQGVLG
jgi:hypothetical protein